MRLNAVKKFIFVQITALILSMSCFCLPVSASRQVSGVWVSTVSNIDFPTKQSLTEGELKKEIDTIVNNCVSNNINTIFFQVRPSADAFYKSDVFPWSEYLSGKQGTAPDNNFDPLKYIIDACHDKSIQLHAWINPYRICKVQKLNALCALNPAITNPEYTVTCSDGFVYFNPALKEVRELVARGVEEILKNYDVDGIHFDDYFYPYNVTDYPDSDDYEKYGKQFDNIGDFRRNNVNMLVKDVCNLVHKYNSVFGISPFGIWDDLKDNPDGSDTNGLSSYSDIYADSRAWVQNGWVDYICPQIYWSAIDENAPFETLVKWWDDLCKKSETDLYIGHAVYKVGGDYKGFDSIDEIENQIDISQRYSSVKGNVFFSYSSMLNAQKLSVTEPKTPAVVSDNLIIASPQNNYITMYSNCSVSGTASVKYPLTVNGKAITLTQNGYFSEYVSLKNGKNIFTFKNGNQTKSITIIKTTIDKDDNDIVLYPDSAFPIGDCIFSPLEKITISIDAVVDAEVYATVGGNDVKLEKTNENNGRATFITSISFPNVLYDSVSFGEISFYAIKDGKRTDYDKKATVTLQSGAKMLYTVNDCYVYDSVFGGSMMDNYQLSKGSIVVATSFANEQYKLLSGKWISKENVSDTPIESELDIKKSNYQKITVSSDDIFELYGYVNDNGVLLVNLYGTSTPEIKNSQQTQCRYISHGNDATIAVSLSDSQITGFFIRRKDDTTAEIYVYHTDNTLEGKKVVIDVGHGGADPGALGPASTNGSTEAALNLSVSKLVAKKLRAKGVKVILTRSKDTTLLLKDRAPLIRSYNPDLCVSIHHNSVSQNDDFNKATGLLVLYSRSVSKPLADAISKNINGSISIKNEGVKKQSLNVCREYRFPSVLIECGYVCNPTEYELILTDEFKNQLAENIVLSICDYFGKNS